MASGSILHVVCVCINRIGTERTLSTGKPEDDLSRLGAALRRVENQCPLKAAAVRLILLTGCRSGEVRRLRWRDVKRDRLVLHEAKTGPRQVPLGEAARTLLDRLSKPRSDEWVFPGAAPEGHMSEWALYCFWCGVLFGTWVARRSAR